jgi:hypothetical protein
LSDFEVSTELAMTSASIRKVPVISPYGSFDASGDGGWSNASASSTTEALRRRTDTPGTQLDLLVLAVDADHIAGVDLASGAMVRAWSPPSRRLAPRALEPYDVVRGTLAPDVDQVPDPTQPEAVVLASAPEQVGRLRRRRAERLLRPLVHPVGQPLLGSHGPTVPFWERRPDHPSIALVEPETQALIYARPERLTCRFRWRDRFVDLPFLDPWVAETMARTGCWRLTSRWGERLVVALTPPIDGHCHKVVATLLRRP